MYLLTSTLTKIDHLTLEEAKELALRGRGEGKRTEILSDEEALKRGFFNPMQDLTKLSHWGIIR